MPAKPGTCSSSSLSRCSLPQPHPEGQGSTTRCVEPAMEFARALGRAASMSSFSLHRYGWSSLDYGCSFTEGRPFRPVGWVSSCTVLGICLRLSIWPSSGPESGSHSPHPCLAALSVRTWHLFRYGSQPAAFIPTTPKLLFIRPLCPSIGLRHHRCPW